MGKNKNIATTKKVLKLSKSKERLTLVANGDTLGVGELSSPVEEYLRSFGRSTGN